MLSRGRPGDRFPRKPMRSPEESAVSETWPGMTGNRHAWCESAPARLMRARALSKRAAKALPAVWPEQRSRP